MQHIDAGYAGDARTILDVVAGTAVALLVTLGVSGSAYQLVAPGGWLPRLFDRSLAGGL